MMLVYAFEPATWLERNYIRESFHSLPRSPNDREMGPEPLTSLLYKIYFLKESELDPPSMSLTSINNFPPTSINEATSLSNVTWPRVKCTGCNKVQLESC